jgi:putative heme-binding domain-containing protein
LLASRQSPEIQSAAASALARIPVSDATKLLLAAWTDAAPALQTHILDLLLARSDGTTAVLDAIENQTIPIRFMDAARRQRLLATRDASLKARAAKLFESAANGDRAKVLLDYRDTTALKGNPDRGKSVFANRCATCHRFNDAGHAVGPDLHSLANKSPDYLLQEILDPNRALDSRYVEYAATTKAGKVLRGIIAAESATSVTLRGPDGKDEILLRSAIDTLESLGRSLMPEGLEKDLSRQDLADVLSLISRTNQ